VVTLIVATITVSASAFVRRTQGATVLAYALTALVTIGAFVLMGVLALVGARDGTGDGPPVAIALMNPVSALAEITDPWNRTEQVEGPLAAVRRLVREDGQGGASGESIAPRWMLSVGSLGLIAGACFLAAQRRIRTPAQVER
jgi:hypothetical protein